MENEQQTTQIQEDVRTKKVYTYKTIQAIVDKDTNEKYDKKIEELNKKGEKTTRSTLGGKIIKEWLEHQ